MADFVTTKHGNSAVTDGGGKAWSNITSVLSLDGSYASCAVTKNSVSQWAKPYNFGFTIPGDATITGIIMRVTRYRQNTSSDKITDTQVFLMDTGRNGKGANYAAGAEWSESVETVNFGGPADMWGTTWTPAEINHENFGTMLECENDSSSSDTSAYIDYFEVSVYYSRPDATHIFLAMSPF